MYSITFSLKDPNAKTESLIYMFVFFNKHYVKISTQQRIAPALWDQARRGVTTNPKVVDQYSEDHPGIEERLQLVNENLNRLRQDVSRYHMEQTLKNRPFNLSQLKQRLTNGGDGPGEIGEKTDRIVEFLKMVIRQMETGNRKQPNGTSYTKGTLKNYRNLLQTLERLEVGTNQPLQWDTVNKMWYFSFIKWHEERGYSANYIGKHVKDLKVIMKTAHEEGFHSNLEFQKRYFVTPKNNIKKTPLSREELMVLEELDLSDQPNLGFARDIFLLGCYLGLRVSDIKRIKPSLLQRDAVGAFLSMKTQKTGTEVKVPVNTKADQILRRYDYIVPEFYEQVVNRLLKSIGKLMELPPERTHKLTLHVSRHTFAKLSYEMGIPSLFIMKITGHASEKNFLRYINIAPDQAVQEFRKYDFFK